MATIDQQLKSLSDKVDGIAKQEDLSPITSSLGELQSDLKALAAQIAAVAAKLPVDG